MTTGCRHDVFKLVSLRGSLDGLAIDPSRDGIDIPILRELAQMDLLHPSPELLRIASGWEPLAEDVLRKLPWAILPAALDGDLGKLLPALLAPELTVGPRGVALAEYSAEPSFLSAYGQLADSWMRLRLRRLWAVNAAPQAEALHERLIRVAHIILRLSRRTAPDRAVLARLATAPIVLRRYSVARPPGPFPRPKAPRQARQLEIANAKREFVRLRDQIGALESIQGKVHSALALRSLESGANVAEKLDTRFYTTFLDRLDATERSVVEERLGAERAAWPQWLPDLLPAMDMAPVIASANDLCSRIRVFEDEEKLELPAARDAQAGPRPAIRGLGWADLVVVRERLVGYDAREIAHIENVLAGEDKIREHERTHRTEELRETETFEQAESERDLQTSERFELQVEAQKAVDSQFAAETGINTSGRYGLTRVETSLDVAFQRSVHESQQRSSALAKEVVARSVERVQRSVRELRRSLTVEERRELSRHSISNSAPGDDGAGPVHRVGLYYWVEKIHELELRQYGTRFMIEFLIPEPGVTLLEKERSPRPDTPKPGPLAIGPHHISPANYLCLAQRYGADGVAPPPAPFVQIGMAWASDVNNATNDKDAEDTVAQMVKVPDGYSPISGRLVVTGRGRTNNDRDDPIHALVSVGGRVVLDSGNSPKSTYTIPSFAVPFQCPTSEEGLPVSIRVAGHDDRTAIVNLAVTCRRSPDAYQKWQLSTYERIREAHAELVREYNEAREEAAYVPDAQVPISGRPSSVNRQLERDELAKWCIKSMRVEPFDFDAIANEDGVQEIDPIAFDSQAPVVRFFEEAFEWREMSYFLYPYFWGRRASWSLRNQVVVKTDPAHETFLRAGAARVLVPVTPGYEARVLQYLDADPTLPDEQRIPPIPPPTDEPPAETEFPDLWLEVLLNRREDMAIGDGTLSIVQGSPQVVLNDSRWELGDRDLGRELVIGGDTYEIVACEVGASDFTLDRPYEGMSNPAARYAAGTIPFGAPWRVRIPTALVVLSDHGADEIMPP